jgi:biotin/methionine sulfoxide reductase
VVLAFGGMAVKNSAVAGGGVSKHIERGSMGAAHARGCRFVLIAPLKDDLPKEAGAEWLPITPGTDTALMLGMAHTLATEGLHDRGLSRPLLRRLAGIRGVSAGPQGRHAEGRRLGRHQRRAGGEHRRNWRDAAGKRVLVTMAHSLQRAEHGEQPVWMGAVLAAMLGQIGLPGGGYGYALGSIAHYGKRKNAVPVAGAAAGAQHGVRAFIPVARIADMLLNPGAPFDYNGQKLAYPDIKLVYWAGGNPFHHHQDSTGCARRSTASTRWWCMRSPGPPRRATPISCCPAP